MELIDIQKKIFEIRDQRVMLDFDLAVLYETDTKRLKEAVRRNSKRFPEDFMFELTREEYETLRSQFATLDGGGRGKYSKYNPFAFTEHGVAMLSGVLHSDKAIEMNITIIRAFIALKEVVLAHNEVGEQLAISRGDWWSMTSSFRRFMTPLKTFWMKRLSRRSGKTGRKLDLKTKKK